MLKKLVKAAVVVEKLSKDAPGAPLGGGWTVEKFASEKPSDHFARELKARRERNLGEEAADKLRQSLAVRVRAFGRQNAEVAETLNNIGIVYKNAGNYSAALSAYNESLSIRKEVFGEVHSEVANTLINIGLVHLSENQFMEASKSFERAFDVRVSVFGRNHIYTKKAKKLAEEAKNDYYTQLLDAADTDPQMSGTPASPKLPALGKDSTNLAPRKRAASLKPGALGPDSQGMQKGAGSTAGAAGRHYSTDEAKKLGSKQFPPGARTISRRLSLPPVSSAGEFSKHEAHTTDTSRFARVTSW